MSGFIHIAETRPAWQRALRMAGTVAALLAVVWYGLSDEGLPEAPATDTATPFVKATPLPAPPRIAPSTALGDGAPVHPHARSTRASTAAEPEIDADDYAARNAGIDVNRLTQTRAVAARTFLSEVLLATGPTSGFVVSEVLPESRYERMGLRPGDVIYSLDTPGVPSIDETSMIALMQQTELRLEVYRNGTLTRLHTNLATPDESDALPR